jgi:hypothetical protein
MEAQELTIELRDEEPNWQIVIMHNRGRIQRMNREKLHNGKFW